MKFTKKQKLYIYNALDKLYREYYNTALVLIKSGLHSNAFYFLTKANEVVDLKKLFL